MEELVSRIINNTLFQKLKPVIENNPWHDHESAYDHLIKTHKIANEQISGNFITNQEAKKLFLGFIEENFDGVKRKDLMLLTALLHDVGKTLYYKDGNQEQALRHENSEGITSFPGHEYWSSTLIPEILKTSGLSEKNIQRITSIVRLHNTYNDSYLKNLPEDLEITIDDMKARAEGFEIETLFNIYCDEFTANISKNAIVKMIKIFNTSSFYTPRDYFIK